MAAAAQDLAVAFPTTPPECDCFSCCTLCDPVLNTCHDINVDPNVSPGCTASTLGDPNLCVPCTKDTACGGTTGCPPGSQSCSNGQACPQGTYCHAGSGCCVGIIQ